MKKSICVVGLGYIGLPTSVMFAINGHDVRGVDVNTRAVDMINNKQLHIEENGLEERLGEAVESGKLVASTEPAEADVFIIAVPSPIREDKTANLEYVQQATKAIVPFVKKGDLVILESTVPPRTVEDVMLPILKESNLIIGEELFVSHSPERVIPGKVFQELVDNDRIVGGINDKSSQLTKELYEVFVKGTIHLTDATTAEMVKVIENTYRDVNIAFANELAMISEQIGVNAWEAIQLANYHPRVNIHTPGPGVGGHCIAVDPWFLAELEPNLSKIIQLSRNTNDFMPMYTADKIEEFLKEEDIDKGKVALFGLSFKANIDDQRESPSLEVIKRLASKGIEYTAYDPHIKELTLRNQTDNREEAIRGADILVILTDHDVFKNMEPSELAEEMRTNIIYDTKNALELEKWERAGFTVKRLGDTKIERAD
ncbi:UDP-N-acetyl-D-mannosamine dehydrogenase [Pontibacillus halophilus JSM 076056 = DSM 19796]|uniref:UDP-N-acetyl-D-mannosamine dehydrogenase n=1 Tax=Pontibacillus halophilus JSM 076056 = DSM 19796 TaxID=1385510 RepID=A0A0A5GRX1_9BACI|nr:nucleotide sugar dehydrogenase [Pontibacillus halophilus]KGX93910.1 UDP-N-acetyl-D-mannosamine dehydrogenase [Pontibacillus halophilus JSM 076056 = DSM 19796]